jgi:hypothetical protein
VRFAHLLPLGTYVHHCCTSEGLVVLRDHTNRIYGVAAAMYRRLNSEDGGERSERGLLKGTPETQLPIGRPEVIHGVT